MRCRDEGRERYGRRGKSKTFLVRWEVEEEEEERGWGWGLVKGKRVKPRGGDSMEVSRG